MTALAAVLGLGTWFLAGGTAAILARLLPWNRRRFGFELGIATLVAVIAGFAATALDFGGLSVADWRAIGFAFFSASAAVAAARLWLEQRV